VSARPAAPREGKDESHVVRVDFLATGNADRPGEPPRAQGLTELCARAIARVGENRAKANPGGDEAIEFGERDLRLRPRQAMVGGRTDALEPSGISGPVLRQEQPEADHYWDFAARERQRHQRLAIGGLAQSGGVLRRNPNRMRPLLRQRRVVDDEKGVGAADDLIGLNRQLPLQRRLVPQSVRHEMVQPIVVARRDPLGHRTDALTLARPNQARHVERTHPSPRLVIKPRQKRRQPRRKAPPQEVLAGLVERVTFHNEENGFCVLRTTGELSPRACSKPRRILSGPPLTSNVPKAPWSPTESARRTACFSRASIALSRPSPSG
jgi:hypothetical protein